MTKHQHLDDHDFSETIVFDFTTRLPGPYACFLLQEMGFKVYKIESERSPDPFNDPIKRDLFFHWYQNINRGKEIVSIESILNLQSLNKNKTVLVLHAFSPHHPFYKMIENLKQSLSRLIILNLQHSRPWHDLNFYSVLEENLPSPPPLPFAGILFSHKIAQAFIKIWSQFHFFKTSFLVESSLNMETEIEKVFTTFKRPDFLKNKPALHLGDYICYRIYPLKNGLLYLAAVEPKYWQNFLNIFDQPLDLNAFTPVDSSEGQTLAQFFLNLSTHDLEKILDKKSALHSTKESKTESIDCCLAWHAL